MNVSHSYFTHVLALNSKIVRNKVFRDELQLLHETVLQVWEMCAPRIGMDWKLGNHFPTVTSGSAPPKIQQGQGHDFVGIGFYLPKIPSLLFPIVT